MSTRSLVLLALLTGCDAARKTRTDSAFAPLPAQCGALEGKEPPALIAEQPTTSSLGTYAIELYRDGLVVRTDLPGTYGPVFPARTYRRCIDAAATAALLSARSNDTADPPETSYPLPPATFCVLPRREPQLVARDDLVCARPRLGRELYDAYAHKAELAYSCQAGSDVCAIELTDSERGSAHDPSLVTWRATIEANGHYRCELRDRPEEAPVRYLADEGELGPDGAKALFARLLDGIATGEQDALTVDHGEAQDRSVALLKRTESDRDTIFKSRLRAPRVHLTRDGALVRQRFVAMASALGRRCVPPP